MLNNLKQFVTNLESKAKQDWKDVWDADRGYFVLFGALVLLMKFRDVIIGILVSSSARVQDNATRQDVKLATQENQANQQADTLVQQAAALPTQEKPVDENWNKK